MHPVRPLLLAAAAAALAACQSTVVPTDSRIPLPQAFDHAKAAKGSADITQWWQQWHDPVLSSLIGQALRDSHNVRIAQSRLNEARATAQLANADLGPKIAAQLNAAAPVGNISNPLGTDARIMAATVPAAADLAKDRFDISARLLSGAVAASWEPDIFGKKRSDADAARAAALGAQEQVYGAQMLLAADIADNYLQARAAQARQTVLRDNIRTLERLLRYTQGRFCAGHTTADSTNAVQSRLLAARAADDLLTAQYALFVRNIAVLSGQVPQGFRLPESSRNLLAAPLPAPAGATPQGLIERRPDLRARAAAVQARAAQVASAKADLLPRFSIDFMAQGIRIDGNTALNGWAGLLSAGIQLPIFTNGRIKANIRAADARLQTALLEYDQNLLKALGEVDNAYQNHAALERQTRLLAQSQQHAAKQADANQRLFRLGSKTLDSALTAQTDANQARDKLIQSQLAQAQTLLGIYKALGGGWSAP